MVSVRLGNWTSSVAFGLIFCSYFLLLHELSSSKDGATERWKLSQGIDPRLHVRAARQCPQSRILSYCSALTLSLMMLISLSITTVISTPTCLQFSTCFVSFFNKTHFPYLPALSLGEGRTNHGTVWKFCWFEIASNKQLHNFILNSVSLRISGHAKKQIPCQKVAWIASGLLSNRILITL